MWTHYKHTWIRTPFSASSHIPLLCSSWGHDDIRGRQVVYRLMAILVLPKMCEQDQEAHQKVIQGLFLPKI